LATTAAVAAQFPGFSKWAFACGHVGNAALQIKPAEYKPQFFTPAEYALLERLTEMIIPSDVTPGAKEAGVAEFIDFMVFSDPDAQYDFRTGLTWMNVHSERIAGKKFTELTPEQQTSLLEPLSQDLREIITGPSRFAFGCVFAEDYALNLGQAWLFRRYGFLSSILLRVFFYLIWHGLWGFVGH